MEETLISFETAKLAKDKGFDLECKYRYYKVYAGSTLNKVGHNVGDFILSTISKNDNSLGVASLAEAPTQALLQKWLREIHKINVSSDLWDFLGKKQLCTYQYNIVKIDPKSDYIKSHKPKAGTKYEEALEIGLQEALKLIKN